MAHSVVAHPQDTRDSSDAPYAPGLHLGSRRSTFQSDQVYPHSADGSCEWPVHHGH